MVIKKYRAILFAVFVLSSHALQHHGGERIPTTDDSAMDAYIEKLIRSVDDDETNETNHIESLSMTRQDLGRKSSMLEAENLEISKSKDDDGEFSPLKNTSPQTKLSKAKSNVKKKKSNRKKRKDSSTRIEKIKEVDESTEEIGTSEQQKQEGLASKASVQKEAQENDNKERHNLVSDAVESVSETVESATISSAANAEIEPNPTPRSPQRRSRIPPPNGLYRFFLSKGLIGRFLVMFFILITELISTLVPNITKAIRAIFPNNSHGAYRVSGTSRPQRKKKKSEIVREADEAAFQQLQRAGKEGGKYRHIVSSDFMKRHGIGPFAASMELSEHSTPENGPLQERAAMNTSNKDEEDEDASWIIEALSSERPDDETADNTPENPETKDIEKNNSRKRRVAQKVYSQRESRVRAAIKIPKKKIKKRSSFGSKLIGKFASTDNRFSRNLLGAYPGDAVPLEEAANAAGLTELARRYGWGDWPDEVDASGNPRRRRRRHTAPSRRINVELDFGGTLDHFDGFDEQPFPEITAIKRSRRFNSRSTIRDDAASETFPDENDSLLHFDRHQSDREATTLDSLLPTYSSSKRVRPATELLSERRNLQKDK